MSEDIGKRTMKESQLEVDVEEHVANNSLSSRSSLALLWPLRGHGTAQEASAIAE